MKSVSDSAMKTRELMGAVQEEYHFVDNFNLDNEVNSIVSDFADLTYIDELSNVKDPEQKYNLIRMEINKRFKESEGGVVNQDPPRTEQDIEALERRLRALEAYEKMRDKYLKEAANSEAETDKDIQQRIASSTSMLAYIELERQIEEKERELMAKEKLLDQMRWDAEFVNYLENQ